MKELEIRAKTIESAIEEAMKRFHVPRQSVRVLEKQDSGDDTLEGEEPLEVCVKLAIDYDHFADLARDRLAGLLRLMGLPAEIGSRIAGNIIHLQVTTNNNPVLIGKRGENLEAIEHIVNRMVNRGERDLPYVVLDIEKYREKRHERLEAIAKRAAQKALRMGGDVPLRPMPPEDRKLVHNLLKSFRGVTTVSQGREGNRYVIVSPESRIPRPPRPMPPR